MRTPDVDIPNLKILKTNYFLIEINELDISTLKCDPELHPQIWDYHINQCDKSMNFFRKNVFILPELSTTCQDTS